MNDVVSKVRQALIDIADEKTRLSGERFFKEEIKLHGVKSADVRKISKTYYKEVKHLSKGEIFRLCEELWKSGYNEEMGVACEWSYSLRAKYTSDDFDIFERWLQLYVSNWASCDTLCNHTIGTVVEMYPEHISRLKEWATSDNRWVKRAAAVTLIIPARRGLFLKDIFEIADTLLLDGDDMVQKGYGWMLKAASEYYQKEVFEYVLSRKDVMPRTSLRYAIEKMPKELKVEAMKK